jgi:hypothetical protein
MDVRFEGGPFDGQTHPIDPEPEAEAVVYWPPDPDPNADSTDIPGQEGFAEYIYQGKGRAAYVGGLVTPDRPPQPGPLAVDKAGATAEPGHAQPAGDEVESARQLEAEAADHLMRDGFARDDIRRLADEYIALDLGTGTDGFVGWVQRRRAVPGSDEPGVPSV